MANREDVRRDGQERQMGGSYTSPIWMIRFGKYGFIDLFGERG